MKPLIHVADVALRDIGKGGAFVAKTGRLGAQVVQRFGYNDWLGEFVEKLRTPERASKNAPSLARALVRLDARASQIISSTRIP